MDIELLQEILDAPDGFREVRHFCEEFEGYHKAKTAVDTWYEKLENILGREELLRLEETISYLCYWENKAYYLFGLHLREELKRAMMEG